MNPETNKFEELTDLSDVERAKRDLEAEFQRATGRLLRPDGTPVPEHWSIFREGEKIVIKDYTFRVDYIGDSVLLLSPCRVPIIGDDAGDSDDE